MNRSIPILFILILTVSSPIMVKPEHALAQITTPTPTPIITTSTISIPTPTPTLPITPIPTPTPVYPTLLVPEFTVKLISSLPEVNKTTIELSIKNQPFDRNNTYHYAFFINVRTKIGNGNWSEIYTPEDGFPTQSNSDYTVLLFSSSSEYDGYFIATTYPYGSIITSPDAQVDFQVQAMVGYRDRGNFSGGIYPYVFTGETSGWSNTQTITILDTSTSSPTPSPSPTPIPSLSSSPTPNISPSPSPTQQPTLEPSPIASHPIDYTPTWMLLITLTLTIVIGVVAYFYFKKKKK